jgi:hypothetical protein
MPARPAPTVQFDHALSLLEAARRTLPFEPAFEPLAPAEPGRVVAVDGSHAVLADTGPVWVVAVTAEAVSWPGPAPATGRPVVVATLAEEADAVVATRHEAAGLSAPGPVRSAEAFAQALRSVEEMEAARHAIGQMEEGQLLLWDGALWDLPPEPARIAKALLEAASIRGVGVVAVAKRSALALGGVPLAPALHAAGPRSAWRVRVPGMERTWVARLHAHATASYRIDATGDGLLPRLLPLCRDAATPGYPYPLALAHRRVALTSGLARELRLGLESAARRRGPAASRLLRDPHTILDRST